MRRVGTVTDGLDHTHDFDVERVTIEPFDLRDAPRHDLVIDRLAYWYYHPREWLKKVALIDDVYLLNSPFTFQSMEKHAAYCAMMRLGLNVPDTVLVPFKNPPEHAKYAFTAARYNRPFDLDAVAEQLGYPLFMKPYDGGAWVGVTRIKDSADLHRAYDDSGQRLMHLQKAVDGYEVFARRLSIGAETMVMNFDPDQPMHGRYSVSHDFLDADIGDEAVTIGRLVNAFFRWEFNSCETLVKDGVVYPIDYANACPDVAITSLHYYFPWAMKALVKWAVFSSVTGRRPRLDLDTRRYFDIADRTTCPTTRSWRCTAHLPTTTSRPSATPTSARPGWPTSTRWRWTGSPGRSSTRCSSTRFARRFRRTSTTSSSPTTAACSASGPGTNLPDSPSRTGALAGLRGPRQQHSRRVRRQLLDAAGSVGRRAGGLRDVLPHRLDGAQHVVGRRRRDRGGELGCRGAGGQIVRAADETVPGAGDPLGQLAVAGDRVGRRLVIEHRLRLVVPQRGEAVAHDLADQLAVAGYPLWRQCAAAASGLPA